MFLKVENEKNLVRDSQNSAILNTDKDSLARSRALRRARATEKDAILRLESEVVELRGQLSKIKNALAGIGITIE